MTRGERLERCAKAAYRDFLTRFPALGAVTERWEDLPPSAQERWIGEAAVVLATAARGTVRVRRVRRGPIWEARCQRCPWFRSGPLRYVHLLASRHAPRHWLFQ